MSGYIESWVAGAPDGRNSIEPVNTERGWAGWIVFAGWMLMLLGCFHLLHGFLALFHDEVFLVRTSGLTVGLDYTVWGWAHIVGGVVAILAGVALQRGRLWARVVAVLVAFLSAIVAMAFLPAYPVWLAILIVVDIVIIWAVTVHGSVMKEAELPQ